ncbi:bifunctional sugar-1-phosphate nucleotidylyltransferase/acetyltransferase [Dehalogenimonas sp. 4OHTPN]|uniref:Bifunctional sugar-1-phosphate nucleotidylyltransferase/acetyltransferase n=1 Tax=Dehalogenimonas sp. 4OHTPN TaxID=3166643 RepID=A0AAU8GB13_9CHLR
MTPAVVIMAAGEGARMRPLTGTRPKVMLPVAGKPILEHLLTECAAAGAGDFVLVVGYHDEVVRNYFTDGSKWGVRIRYVTQRQPAGTADALRQSSHFLGAAFVLLNGDIMLKSIDIVPLIEAETNLLSIVELPNVEGKGVMETRGGQVVRLYEKCTRPPTRLANAGAYHFTGDILKFVQQTPRSPRGEHEITDTVQALIDAGIPVGYRSVSTWSELSYPWDLFQANESALANCPPSVEGMIEPGATITGSVAVGHGSLIKAGSYITGPVKIGRNCVIGPNCHIRPATDIGDECHIGAGVEIKNSIIMTGTRIPHLSYVGDSIIGQNCNLGAGTQIANLRLDKKAIAVNGINTGRQKLGGIFGDGVVTGINASINPGTMVGHGARIGPGATAKGIIAPGARIY